MIKANEIRVGNVIRYSDHIVKVRSVHENGYVSTIPTVDGYLDEYDGVKLTQDVLKKSGFKFREHLDDHYVRISEFNDRNDILIISKYNTLVCASNSQPVFFKHVTYLHQLQNLYYSLTGSELPLELTQVERSVATDAR